MPVPIRRFNIQKINEYVKQKEEEEEERSGKVRLSPENNPMGNMPKQAMEALKKDASQAKKPTYTTNLKPKK